MLHVKFSSIYEERDRYGNSRRWENSLEAMGEAFEVRGLLADLMSRSSLPGLTTLSLEDKYRKLLE